MSTPVVHLFPSLSGDQIPAASRPLLDKVKQSFGFVPNLFAAFANSPVVLEGYLALNAVFDKGSLTPAERHIVLLAASVANECGYCIAAHSTILKGMLKIAPDVVSAIRAQKPVANAKYDALVNLTRAIVTERGHVPAETLEAFVAAGFRNDQVAEVLVGVALKTMSNYTDHLSHTEIDAAFAAEK
jgi:uncharacterized peroxidase-related enzyme